MAYGVKYRFFFESVSGLEWTIDILKDGYSGAVRNRALGGAPMLRKDQNDNICGTSLDLTAECSVDGEYEEFSTSDPFAFQAKVYRESTLVWQGFVSPEMYSAPDIAPPYDVRVTCVDGLGELKRNYFEAQGSVSVSALLTYLLGFTGLNLSFRHISDLSCSAASAASLLTSVYVDLDYLEGETCYDVLQTLMATIHSTITQDGEYWLIMKETGMTYNQGNSTVACYVGGLSRQRTVAHFGSLTTHQSSFWPVGSMSREYVAPRKKMIVTSDNHYIPNLLGSWTLDGSTTNDGSYWSLPGAGDGMSQTVSFSEEVGKHLMLSIKVRNVGDGQDAGSLSVYVRLAGSFYQAGSYLYLQKYTGARRRDGNDVIWSTNSGTCDLEVQAPVESDTDNDYVTINVLIPLYYNSARSFVRASSLEVSIANGDALYPKRIYGVSLYQYEQTKGFQKVININNGARGESSDVNLAFACTTDANNYNGLERLLYGVPTTSAGAKILLWSTGAFSDLDFLSLISRDYSLSVAASRVRVSGVLQAPPSGSAVPLFFVDDHDSTLYIVESFSWDLYNDEISVQMISRPASSITVEGESIDEGETDNTTGHAQTDSSASGGGGGESYTLPTASATTLGGVKVGSGLSIDGNGVLSAGGGSGKQIYELSDNGTSTAGTWLGQNADITALTDGMLVTYKLTKAGASTTRLNVNGLGAKTVYRYGSTKLTTQYAVGSILLLQYNASLNSGCWMVVNDYDANSYAYVRQYQSVATENEEYPVLHRYDTAAPSSTGSYVTKYTEYTDDVTINPSTGILSASGFKVPGASGFLKSDGTVDTMTSQPSLQAPIIEIQRGWRQGSVEVAGRIKATHPGIGVLPNAEFVLMSMAKRRGRDSGLSNTQSFSRGGWGCAQGRYSASNISFSDTVDLDIIRGFIIRNYLCAQGTASWLTNYTVAQFKALTVDVGFGHAGSGYSVADFKKKTRRSRLFGIALRYENPAFTALVSGTLSYHTTAIYSNGVYVPRWIYTDVAPIRVHAHKAWTNGSGGGGSVVGFELLE